MTTGPRIAVVGAGAWGSNHVRVVSASPRCELSCIVDRDRVACEKARTLASAPTSLDIDYILSDPAIDAVIVATPAPTHVGIARAALEAGKHVLVEKPLALSEADAIELAAVAARTPRVLLVGHLMVYHPAVIRLRELLRSGAARAAPLRPLDPGEPRADPSATRTRCGASVPTSYRCSTSCSASHRSTSPLAASA